MPIRSPSPTARKTARADELNESVAEFVGEIVVVVAFSGRPAVGTPDQSMPRVLITPVITTHQDPSGQQGKTVGQWYWSMLARCQCRRHEGSDYACLCRLRQPAKVGS